jgi:hypothetical protein
VNRPFTIIWQRSLLCVLCLSGILGCGSRSDHWTKQRPQVYRVAGQVLLNGEPVGKATLTFQPLDEDGKPGFALTDDRGYFNVQTFEPGDGLTEGGHRVSIRKTHLVDRSGKIVQQVLDDGGGLVEKHFLPEHYADFTTSGIQIQVEAKKSNRLDPFQLTD